uniref:Chromo domain-containing protein n=1 Tax=Meloidogyne javanica TaxID=6303 RepID=A0A915N9A3_MELJA
MTESDSSSTSLSSLTPSEEEHVAKDIKRKESEDVQTSEKVDQETISHGSDSTAEDERVFEVESINGHKKVHGKDYWLVRWSGYGPEHDTWEPNSNLLSENVRVMCKEYLDNNRSAKRSRNRRSSGKVSQRRSVIKKPKAEEEPVQSEQPKVEESSEKSESGEEVDGTNSEGWFGIKPGEGSREQQRLFVPDRRLSKTEKLLSEINCSPGVRVLRNQLKPHSGDFSDGASASTTSPKKRGRAPRKSAIEKLLSTSSDVFTSESSPALDVGQKTGITDNEEDKLKKDEKIEKTRQKKPSKAVKKFDSFKEPDSINKQEVKKAVSDVNDFLLDPIKSTIKQSVSELDLAPKPGSSEIHTQQKQPSPSIVKPILISHPKLERKTESKEGKQFGVSGNLKHVKRDGKKLSSETSTSSKKKIKKIAPVASLSSTDLPLKLLPDGANIALETEKMLKKKLSKKADTPPVTQEEFDELVLDGKVEKVRELLLVNGQKSFLDLNRCDDLGKALVHKNGARLDMAEHSNGQIPLHIAIANRRICHVKTLLSLRTPLNSPDRSGKTPAMQALECSSDYDFLKLLLSFVSDKVYKDKEKYKKQLRIISEHESRIRRAFNSARTNVTMEMTLRNVSQVFVSPLHEGEMIQNFTLNTQPQLPDTNHAYVLFVAVAEFQCDDTDKELCCTVNARMWGRSPVISAIMNDKECVQLKSGNNFAFLCVPCRDRNVIRMKFDPALIDFSDLMVLVQMVLVQMHNRPANSRLIH